jgi:hypothetical protein
MLAELTFNEPLRKKKTPQSYSIEKNSSLKPKKFPKTIIVIVFGEDLCQLLTDAKYCFTGRRF